MVKLSMVIFWNPSLRILSNASEALFGVVKFLLHYTGDFCKKGNEKVICVAPGRPLYKACVSFNFIHFMIFFSHDIFSN